MLFGIYQMHVCATSSYIYEGSGRLLTVGSLHRLAEVTVRAHSTTIPPVKTRSRLHVISTQIHEIS